MPNRIKSYVLQASHALRLRGPLAGDLRARTLHGLIIGLLLYVWIVHLPIMVPLFVVRKAGSTLAYLFLTLIYVFTLVLLKRGSLRQASMFFLVGTWLAATAFVVLAGGIQSAALVHYVYMPILAAWLLGTTAAGVTTAACLGSSLALAIIQQSGVLLPHYFPGSPFSNWSFVVMATLGAVVPVLFVLGALNEALEKRQGAEEELRQANEKLERRVRERTAQLEDEIAERKRLEANLEVAARFPGENPNPVMRLGQGHLVDFANPPAQELLRTLGCTLASEAPAEIAGPAMTALSAGVAQNIERTCAGRTFLFSLSPIPQWGYVNLYATDITDRKQAEEALRESEERLQAILDGATGTAVFLKDVEGRFITANTAFEKLLGIKRDELRGKTDHDLISKDRADTYRAIDAQVLKTSMPIQIEETALLADGKDHVFLSNKFPLSDASGKPYAICAVSADITQQKKAEAALRESEQLFRTVIENSRDGINMMDLATGRYTFMSPAQVELTGFSAEEMNSISAQEAFERVHPDDREVSRSQQEKIIAGEDLPTPAEYRWRVKSGEYRWFSDSRKAIRDEQGRAVALVGVSRDITERKRAEEALRASESRFRVLAEAMPQIVWAADTTGAVEYVNPQGLKYVGVGLENVQDWKWTAIIHPDDLAAMEGGWRQTLTSGESDQIEHRLRRADGEFRWHLTRAVPLRNQTGEVIHWIGTTTDIHDQKRAEQELERRVAERTAELARSTALLETVTSNAPVILFATDARGVFTLYTGKAITAAGHTLGDFLGKGFREARTFDPTTVDGIRRALEGVESSVIGRGLLDTTFETSFTPLRDADGNIAGMVGVSVNITERTHAEAALRESQALMSSIVDSTSDLIWSVEPERFGLLTFNTALRDSFLRRGVHLQAGMRPEDAFADKNLAERWRGIYQRALEEGPYTIDYESPTAGNMVVTVNLLKRDGKVFGISVFAKDITQRVRADRELHRVNRALRALSATDQAMVRARDESELLQETCRILVEEGGYRFAWVGLAEQDEAKTVRPVAHAGIEQGYLETARVTWADTARGGGPTGTAIRTERPVVCQNMLEDPRVGPWREEAGRRGYASSCALPLVVGGKSIGALTVYSALPDAFDAAEADLLAQLGADVAFGIESLRARAELYRAMEALQKSEWRYKNFISHTTDGIWRFELAKPLPVGLPEDESLRWLFEQGYLAECNPAYAAIYGCSDSDQLVGKHLGELVPTWDEARIDSFRSMVRGGFQTRTIELRGRDATGEFRDLLRSEVPIVEDGLLLRFWGITSDITERKRRERDLRRLNRALRILSSSNQALVRAQAESQLPQEICRILVEQGGYRMAWMGFAEHDAEKTLRPVAFAGAEEGYLASVKLTWADTERGRGPSGVAIRTGQPSVCNNIMEDPQFALWREDALRRGYASTCVLPINLPDKSIAILAAYSPVPDAFDAAEVKLLAELADDISYGFHVLHTRAERQQAMETLEKHSAQLSEQARLLELAPVAVLVRDLESRVTYWNRGAEEIYGWTSTEASGKVTHKLLQTKFPEPFSEMEAKIFSGVPWQGELTHRKRTGEEVVVVSRQVLRRDKQGNPTGYLEINLDISARKQAEEALKAERQRFFAVLETLPPMICLLTPDYHVAFANRAFRERFGESQGRRCYDYCFGRPSPCEFCETYNVLKTGQPHRWEVKSPDGSVIEAYDFPFTDVDGTPMILEMDLDITEAERAKEGLEKANAYNRSLLEASLDPLVTISPNGKITDVNSAAEKITGRLREELIGADFSDYFTDPEKARLGYQRVFKEGLVQDYELEVRRRDGSTTPVLYNASVYRDQGGEVVGVFAAARDITTRKRAEEEVRRLNEELEQRVQLRTAQLEASNQELEAFTYSVSHDLRAPLRAMDGFSRILLEEYQPHLPAEAQKYLDFVRGGAVHMGKLIDGLLALSRLGRQDLKKRPVEVSEIVRQSRDDLRPDFEGRAVEFTLGALPACEADPVLLRQVFVNLLSNALKFSRKKKKVRIEVGALKASELAQPLVAGEPQARVPVLPALPPSLDPNSWVYYVRDNGVGFDMRHADKLFGVFQRLHRQADFEGTGLGLATVRQIIRKHGGETWAEGVVDNGATFYFTLGPSVGETIDTRGE